MPIITVFSVYKKASTTLRPQRCSYAGDDGINFEAMPLIDGYGPWQPLQSGDYIARKIA